MYEGFANYDEYISSVCDGFANMFNDRITNDMELISNQEAYEIILKGFGENASIERIKGVTDAQLESMLNYVNDPEYSYEFDKNDIIECLKYSLAQSVGK